MGFGVDAAALQAGLVVGAASLLSIGPNTLLLIREGLTRGHGFVAASLVLLSYASLILASMSVCHLVDGIEPQLSRALTASGVVVLAWFGLRSLRAARARRALALRPAGRERPRACAVRVMKIVWMNPLTYLERFFVPAAVTNLFGATAERWSVVLALLVTAAAGCYGVVLGGRLAGAVLPPAVSVWAFDLVAGLLLLAIAGWMTLELVGLR